MALDPPIVHLTHMKAGSQWVRQVLGDAFRGRLVHAITGNVHFTRTVVLPGLVYPAVYMTREEVEACNPPPGWRGFVVIRDLRDTLVSMAYSLRYSHPELDDPVFAEDVATVRSASFDEGMRFLMQGRLRRQARIQASWMEAGLPVIRFEDLVADPVPQFRTLLAHCGLRTTERQVRALLAPAAFAARAGRPAGTEDPTSHYRKGIVGDWRAHLFGELLEEFKAQFDDVLIATGYEQDGGWGNSSGEVAAPSLPPPPAPAARRTPAEFAASKLQLERDLDGFLLTEILTEATDPLVSDRLTFGPGFHALELDAETPFRWAGEDAALVVHRASGRRGGVVLDVAPGPSVGGAGYTVELLDMDETVLASVPGPAERAELRLEAAVPAGERVVLLLRCNPGGHEVPGPEHRVLNLQVFAVGLL